MECFGHFTHLIWAEEIRRTVALIGLPGAGKALMPTRLDCGPPSHGILDTRISLLTLDMLLYMQPVLASEVQLCADVNPYSKRQTNRGHQDQLHANRPGLQPDRNEPVARQLRPDRRPQHSTQQSPLSRKTDRQQRLLRIEDATPPL